MCSSDFSAIFKFNQTVMSHDGALVSTTDTPVHVTGEGKKSQGVFVSSKYNCWHYT